MARISEKALEEVALAIEPHTTAIKEEHGQLTDKDISALAKLHAKHHIQSERSCQIVDELLTGEREFVHH